MSPIYRCIIWRLTILHRLDEQRDDDVVGSGYPMNLQILRQIARTVDQSLRESTLPVVAFAVFDQERVFREFRSPGDDCGNKAAANVCTAVSYNCKIRLIQTHALCSGF